MQEEAEKLQSVVPRVVLPDGLLYVNQREFAVVSQQNGNVRIIGSDDATTCHIVIIRHSGTGVTGLAHCDGCDTERGLQKMIHQINTLSESGSNGRLEVTFVGGFNDDKKTSEKLSLEIIGFLQTLNEDLHLICTCITDYNNVLKNGINFPVIYGVAVDVCSGEIYPARFVDKGPEIDIRSACHFGGFKDLVNIYDNEQHHLVIGPYTWKSMDNVDWWLVAPDVFIRKYLSTSPQQEPPEFEKHVRDSLRVLAKHPNPNQTLFVDGKAHRYEMNEDGVWVKVTDGL
ncbi:hypothetical protein LSH36_624g01074 [Paralvinella palmiformis]|uniref:Protein N-terminal asparagine amidohydrolase n=1 Tax=Paralvinella palmiformis TaxID=53620 RepID=A0AAD9J541_9ANNE|nr:hypothetical protein LSH36_624g01074 [Paralvinella palmiformis]